MTEPYMPSSSCIKAAAVLAGRACTSIILVAIRAIFSNVNEEAISKLKLCGKNAIWLLCLRHEGQQAEAEIRHRKKGAADESSADNGERVHCTSCLL